MEYSLIPSFLKRGDYKMILKKIFINSIIKKHVIRMLIAQALLFLFFIILTILFFPDNYSSFFPFLNFFTPQTLIFFIINIVFAILIPKIVSDNFYLWLFGFFIQFILFCFYIPEFSFYNFENSQDSRIVLALKLTLTILLIQLLPYLISLGAVKSKKEKLKSEDAKETNNQILH